MTSYRLALALPLLLVLVSDAWAQGTQPNATQAPAAATPADQQAASDEPIGNVATLTGTATVTRNKRRDAAQAEGRHLSSTTWCDRGDLLARHHLQRRHHLQADGQRAGSRSTITSMKTAARRTPAIFDIAKGTVAFVAAAVAKTGNMQITTPTATLGIRGTTGLVEVPEGGAAATSANKWHQALSRCRRTRRQIEVNDRSGARLGALTQGASGFAIRGGAGGARFAAVPLTISPQQAQRDQGFVRQVHATQTRGAADRHRAARLPPRQSGSQPAQQPRAAAWPEPSRPAATGHDAQPSRPAADDAEQSAGQPGAPNRQGQQQQPGSRNSPVRRTVKVSNNSPARRNSPVRPRDRGNQALLQQARRSPTRCRVLRARHRRAHPPLDRAPVQRRARHLASGRPGGPRLPVLPKGKPPPPNKKKR